MENNDIYDIINNQSKVLVGQLLKRVEVLESENALTPELYKKLAKEQVYEWTRTLITILKIGKVVFTSKKGE